MVKNIASLMEDREIIILINKRNMCKNYQIITALLSILLLLFYALIS